MGNKTTTNFYVTKSGLTVITEEGKLPVTNSITPNWWDNKVHEPFKWGYLWTRAWWEGWNSETCNDVESSRSQGGVDWSEEETYSQTENAKMALRTGGKAVPKRENVWKLDCPVYLQPIRWQDLADSSVDPTTVTIGEMGAPGADGNLWKVLPDGVAVDITPSVTPDMDYYDFCIMEGKRSITITANGQDMESTNTPEFCVGQNVVFSLNGIPSSNAPQGSWTIPGNYVNQPTNNSAGCTWYTENDDLLIPPSLQRTGS